MVTVIKLLLTAIRDVRRPFRGHSIITPSLGVDAILQSVIFDDENKFISRHVCQAIDKPKLELTLSGLDLGEA